MGSIKHLWLSQVFKINKNIDDWLIKLCFYHPEESPSIHQFSRTLGLNLDEARNLIHFFRTVDLDDYTKLEFDLGLTQEDIDGFKILSEKLVNSKFFAEMLYVEI